MKKVLVVWSVFFFICTGFSQERNWFSLPEELSGGEVYKLIEFQGSLIACGTFTVAGGQPVNGIAIWNGSSWAQLGSGLTLNGGLAYPLDMAVYHDSLYVVGNFDTAGTVSSVDIAGWDGSNWFSMGTGTNLFVNSIEVFNDTLFVGGQFDTINGIEAKGISKWNGSSWEGVGGGLRNVGGYGAVGKLHTYQSKLFATGVIDSAGTVGCENIAYWDGFNWGTVPATPPYLAPGTNLTMTTWNDSLIIYGGAGDIGSDIMTETYYWDGATFGWYSWQAMSSCVALEVFEGELYGGGGDIHYNYGNTVRKWNGSSWEFAGSGLNDYVQTFCIYNGDLYAGGNFTESTGSQHNYIARFALMNGIGEIDTIQNLQIYPNPFSENITLQFEVEQKENVVIQIFDFQGRLIREISNQSFELGPQKIDSNLSELQNGTYFIRVSIDGQISYRTIVKH